MFPLLIVLLTALAVVIIFVLIRHRKKRNPSAVAALCTTGVPNNAATITAAKKGQEFNNDFVNPTYEALKENEYAVLPDYENNMLTAVQDDEIPYENVQY